MTISTKKMKPVEMVRLLNSTELGTVLSTAKIYRHFSEAGYRIASAEDSRALNFYRYAAWLVDKRNRPQETSQQGGYAAHREAAAQRQADLSLQGRDIGELPAVVLIHFFNIEFSKYWMQPIGIMRPLGDNQC